MSRFWSLVSYSQIIIIFTAWTSRNSIRYIIYTIYIISTKVETKLFQNVSKYHKPNETRKICQCQKIFTTDMANRVKIDIFLTWLCYWKELLANKGEESMRWKCNMVNSSTIEKASFLLDLSQVTIYCYWLAE